MAFKKTYLNKFGVLYHDDAGAPTGAIYSYTTLDAPAAVRAAGYFNAVRSTLYVGDLILAECNGVIRHLKVATVPADPAVNVTTTDASASGSKVFVAGQATTVTANDAIVTGLGVLTAAGATLESDPVLTCDRATAQIGDQAGAPAAGTIALKTWMPTSNANPTPIAATTFVKKVNWWAWGLLP